MNIDLSKEERWALQKLLLVATGSGPMAAMRLRVGGPEFNVALKVVGELQKVFDVGPDCDAGGKS